MVLDVCRFEDRISNDDYVERNLSANVYIILIFYFVLNR